MSSGLPPLPDSRTFLTLRLSQAPPRESGLSPTRPDYVVRSASSARTVGTNSLGISITVCVESSKSSLILGNRFVLGQRIIVLKDAPDALFVPFGREFGCVLYPLLPAVAEVGVDVLGLAAVGRQQHQ